MLLIIFVLILLELFLFLQLCPELYLAWSFLVWWFFLWVIQFEWLFDPFHSSLYVFVCIRLYFHITDLIFTSLLHAKPRLDFLENGSLWDELQSCHCPDHVINRPMFLVFFHQMQGWRECLLESMNIKPLPTKVLSGWFEVCLKDLQVKPGVETS